jgi:hypothetical protein
MDLDPLIATLQKAILPDLSLPFTGGLTSTSDLDALLSRYFDAGVVTVSRASVKPGEDGASAVVAGSVAYNDAANCTVTIVLTPGASGATLALTLTPPAGWSLAQPFPSVVDPTLSGLRFASGGLVICSAPYREPSQGLTLAPGMTVVAALDLANSYPYLTPLLGASPVPIHGVVSDPQLPQMVLQTALLPAKLGDVELAKTSLTFTLGNLADAGEPPIGCASAALQASIALAPDVGGVVTAVLPSASSTLALDVEFEHVTLKNLALLAPLIGDADPIASLPSEISEALARAGSAFALTSLGLHFDVATMKFLAVDVVVTVDLRGFGPFTALPVLKLDDIVIEWAIDTALSPAVSTFAATADIEVTPTCPVTLGVQTQPGGGYLIALRENTDAVLKLADIVKIFLPGLAMPELDIANLSITLAPREDLYTFGAAIEGSWTVLESIGIELATVNVEALYCGSMTPSLSGSVNGVLQLEVPQRAGAAATSASSSAHSSVAPPPGTIDIELSATRPAGVEGWQLVGQSGVDEVVPVGDLIAALVHKFEVTAVVPAAIESLTIENLGLRMDTANESFAFGCQVEIEIAGEKVGLVVSVTKTGACRELSLGGTILIGSLEFVLAFDKSDTSTSFVAVYTHKPGDPERIALRDLVSGISSTAAAEVPGDIEIQLDGVKLVFVKQDAATEFAFSLDLSLSFGLSDLPLVGHVLPNESVSIEHLQLLYSTAQLTAEEAGKVNGLLPSTVAQLPAAGLSPGAAVTATVLLDGARTPIAFGVPSAAATSTAASGGNTAPPASAPAPVAGATTPAVGATTHAVGTTTSAAGTITPAAGTTTPAAAPASQPTAHWFDIQKTFGPVSIGRLGVQYQDSSLFFLIDASMSMGPLGVGLEGLGLGSPLSEFSPRVHLDGLSISFSEGPVSIDGGFLAIPSPPPGVTDEYMGALTIAIEPYLISGIGAYAKVGGNPSFFVFAEVDGEFGGPPAFFVTGFMGGLGYNWALTLPPAEQVYTFPFVSGLGDPACFGSANPTPLQVLDALSGQGTSKTAWVTPSNGQNWIAGGLQFRSFELVLGRALAVVEFGRSFEVALLGLATIALPQGSAADAYAYAELQLEVVLKPDDGVFSAIASLTPNSYVLTRQCHLTGGFAFCLWFGSNPHAGDFVLTIGGYHPAFDRPEWYPVVPRVGFNWSVDDNIVVKGGAYFAITPTAAMAGGSLEVLFHAGDLRAWLTAYADVMVRWRPFYLTAAAGVSVGVSYKLDLLFTTTTLSVELGATLELWGPPTGGVVHVDWYIVSFSIAFGAKSASAKDLTLDWHGFQALLPGKADTAQPPDRPGSTPDAGAARQRAVLSLAIGRGLSRTDSASGAWIVRADELVLSCASAIPITSILFGTLAVALPKNAPHTIDIRPMGASGVTSTCTITITALDAGQPEALASWPAPTVQTASLPEALWGKPIAGKDAPAPTARLIENLPTGLTFAPPAASAGSAIGPVDPGGLVAPVGHGAMPLAPAQKLDPIAAPTAEPGSIAAPTADPESIAAPTAEPESIAAIAAGVASPASVLAQQRLVAALGAYGAAPPTSAPLVELGRQAGAVFSEPPLWTA